MDENLRKFLQSITYTASVAADEAKAAVQSASKAINQKADVAKMNIKLLSLRAEMEDIFVEIGRDVFLMNSGSYNSLLHGEDGEEGSAQQRINAKLVKAGEVQQEIDAIVEKLDNAKGCHVCPNCKKVCDENDLFCPACGTKLDNEATAPSEE